MSDIFNDSLNEQNTEQSPVNQTEHIPGNPFSENAPQENNTPLNNEYVNYYSDNNSSSYAYTSGSSQNKKKKRHPVLKGIAFVLCLAIVSVGSVGGYKIYLDHKDKSKISEFDADSTKTSKENTDDDDEEDDNAASKDKELPSIITLASREDAKPIPEIVESIMPSVVGVSAVFEYTPQSYDFFGWGNNQPSSTQKMTGTGTGFIISEDGYIATNAHCVFDNSEEYNAGKAVEVSIMFSDESESEAKIIAYDTETDIAVLKVDKTGLTPATLGDSNDLKVGEGVIAIGNPLGFELFGSVTSGIVSALNREISVNEKSMRLIQTDAAINSGNSGGPLLNTCGQVIGINSAKMSSSYGSASVEGLGFAIPMTEAKVIIDDLINYKYVRGRPQFGISTQNITEAYSRYLNVPMGVYIADVEKGSAAETAGLMKNDIIVEIDGKVITTVDELNTEKNKHKAGETVKLTVYRSGSKINVKVVLQEKNAEAKIDPEEPVVQE